MSELLKLISVTKTYGSQKVLKGIDLNLIEGDIYGLIGPNGAGKSTLIKIILGLVHKNSGQVLFEGKEMSTDSIRKKISATIEEPAFYEYMTGLENLEIHRKLLGLEKNKSEEMLDLVSMSDNANKKVTKYSMGMKQRLAIARAFISSPKVMILDEPTNGLDPNGVIELRKLIKSIQKYLWLRK